MPRDGTVRRKEIEDVFKTLGLDTEERRSQFSRIPTLAEDADTRTKKVVLVEPTHSTNAVVSDTKGEADAELE